MHRDSLENRITDSFIDRLKANTELSDEFPEILREEMDESSFGNDDTIINAVIEEHEE